MDIFFQDLDEVPLPPEEVRLRSLTAELYPDTRRLRVATVITPFQKRPSLDISVRNANGDELAQADVIETMTPRLEFTLHLRGGESSMPLLLNVILFYADTPNAENPQLSERRVVDTREISVTSAPSFRA